jgi:hypothetical protein
VKRCAVLSVLILLLASAAVAHATVKMPFGFAKTQTKVLARDYCNNNPGCTYWQVGKCARFSTGRVDCGVYTEYRNDEYCTFIVINRSKGNTGYFSQRIRRTQCKKAG